MTKKKKQILIAVGAVVLLLIVVNAVRGNDQAQQEQEPQKVVKQIQVQKVQRQDQIKRSLSASGTVVPKQFTEVHSLTQGTVEFIVPVGETVVRGQSLFSIRDANVENNYFNALQNVRQTESSTAQRVTQAELAVNSAQARFNLAQKNITNTQSQIKQSLSNSKSSAVVTYNSAYTASKQVMDFLSIGKIEELNNYRYRGIVTTEVQMGIDAPQVYNTAAQAFLKVKPSATIDTVEDELQVLHDAMVEVKDIVDHTLIILRTAIPGSNEVVANLESDIATISSYQNSINQLINSVISSSNAIINTQINNDIQLDQAENQLELAEVELNNAKVSLESAKISAELELTASRSQLDNASYSYNNLSLRSPFSGTVLAHNVSIGQQVNVGQGVLEIGDLDIIEIEVQVDTEFSQGLRVGDTVAIAGDATGIITEIEPSANIATGKVGITIQRDNTDKKFVSGQVASVALELTNEVSGAIVIPLKSATVENTGTYVLVVNDGIAEKRAITLGRVFGTQVEVTSGLEEGDQVILVTGVFVTPGDHVEITN